MMKSQQYALLVLLIVLAVGIVALLRGGQRSPFQAQQRQEDVLDRKPIEGKVVNKTGDVLEIDISVYLSTRVPNVRVALTPETNINLVEAQRAGTLADVVVGDYVSVITADASSGQTPAALFIDLFK